MVSVIRYLLDNTFEADERLSDALLFAALRQQLGDRIEAVDANRDLSIHRPLWGAERFKVRSDRISQICRAYEAPAVLEALGGRILPKHAVQEEMNRLAILGHGAILRNMRHPQDFVRHCSRGDRFDQHASAIRSDCSPNPVLVQPNYNLKYVRRFVIVAGEVATDTPYQYCENAALHLMNPANRRLQAESFMSPLEACDPVWTDLQREAADRLLKDYPLASGAIDVGLRITADGNVAAHVQGVVAAPPGAFSVFYADVAAYVKKISESLAVLEPDLTDPSEELEP